MRYLILSDIHSNLEALQASLAAAEGRYDQCICCGDIVGYGADPNAATEWVRANTMAVVRGNHDKAGCGITQAEEFNAAARAAALWTRIQLTPENLEYLKALPQGPRRVDDFQIVHGAPSDEDEYLLGSHDAASEFENLDIQVTIFGHTHVQGGFALSEDQVMILKPNYDPGISTRILQIEQQEKYLLNPGSIGQPRDGDSRAAFAIYRPEEAVVEYWRVPYNIYAAQQKMVAAGLPEVLAYRLNIGR